MQNENSDIAIVAIAYNRPASLKRLIDSLVAADYLGDKIDLIISVDYSETTTVREYTATVEWPHGHKKLIFHPRRLGLKNHILKCGDLTDQYKHLCVFEDDIYVSPAYYNFARAAIEHFDSWDNVAGISLYAYEWNPYVDRPFKAVEDGFDAYLMQIASSWGQIWSRNSWKQFREWLHGKADEDLFHIDVPVEVANWSAKSWLKFHDAYLVDKRKFFVHPKISLTTNFSDPGEHASGSLAYQVPLLMGVGRKYCFPKSIFEATRYDAFFESINLKEVLAEKYKDIEIDLYGNKPIKARYLVTDKVLGYQVVASYGMKLRPIELNISNSIPGNDIFVYDTHKIKKNNRSVLKSRVHRFLFEARSSAKREMVLGGAYLFIKSFLRRL